MWPLTDPFWDTVFRWATISALAFGGVGVASAFVSAWVGYQITDATQKDADKRLTAAKLDVARLQRETEQLRNTNLALEKKISPRRPTRRPTCKDYRYPSQTYRPSYVLSYALDVESAMLGLQLINELQNHRLPLLIASFSFCARRHPNGDKYLWVRSRIGR